MPYWSGSPSSNNSISSNRHWVAFQRDGLYSGTEGKSREHLKYNIRNFFRFWGDSSNFEFFCWVLCTRFIIFPVLLKLIKDVTLNAFDPYWTENRYSNCELLSRYCFIWEGNFIHLHEFEFILYIRLGRVLSRDFTETWNM